MFEVVFKRLVWNLRRWKAHSSPQPIDQTPVWNTKVLMKTVLRLPSYLPIPLSFFPRGLSFRNPYSVHRIPLNSWRSILQIFWFMYHLSSLKWKISEDKEYGFSGLVSWGANDWMTPSGSAAGTGPSSAGSIKPVMATPSGDATQASASAYLQEVC